MGDVKARGNGHERAAAIAGEMAKRCIAVRVRTLSRAVSAVYDAAFRPYGVKVGQVSILVALQRLHPASPRDVCAALHLDTSTLSRNVARLQRSGWVARVRPGAGGRARLELTPRGRALLQRVRPAWERAQEQATALLGVAGVTQIAGLRRRLGSAAPRPSSAA